MKNPWLLGTALPLAFGTLGGRFGDRQNATIQGNHLQLAL